MELKSSFGASNEFIKSILHNNKPNIINNKESSNSLIKEAKFLASCCYGSQTKWGKEVSVVYKQFILIFLVLSWITNRFQFFLPFDFGIPGRFPVLCNC